MFIAFRSFDEQYTRTVDETKDSRKARDNDASLLRHCRCTVCDNDKS